MAQTTLKNNTYSFDGRTDTYTQIYETRKGYREGDWCGIDISILDKCMQSIEEFANSIHHVTTLVPLQLILCLYNKKNNFIEFEGVPTVRTIKNGWGEAGAAMDYRHKYGEHQVFTGLHEKSWVTCEHEFFAYCFCTEIQWQLIRYLS